MYWYLLILLVQVIHGNDVKHYFDQGFQAFKQQQYAKAEECFIKADTILPNQHNILFNLARCYQKQDKNEQAIELLKRIISLKPDYINPYQPLIDLLQKTGNHAEIENLYLQLLQYEPNNVQAYRTLGDIYKGQERFQESIDCYLKAREIEPGNLTICFSLAIAYILIGQTEKAIACYQEILAVHPTNITVLYNTGYAYKMQGEPDKAIEYYNKALAINPDYDEAHFGLGMAYLVKGDYEHGWNQHERYLKRVGKNADKLRTFFNEGTTEGKTILLYIEGGLGDTINFVRYARELKRYGITVIVVVQKPLINLLKRCHYIDHLITLQDSFSHVDDRTSLMSIPAILYAHEHKLPEFEPYIEPDPALVTYWGDYLKDDTNFKIGLCWEASVYNDSSRPPVARRGIPLEKLYILSELDNVSLYSLQQADGVEQLNTIPPYFKIHQFDESFDKQHGSFMDTAAVMKHLDLVITVDTATAHLAGAMGVNVWLLLPWSTDWRWIAKSKTTPWYPSMHIFHQPKPFDWDSVVQEVFWQLMQHLSKF